MSLLPGWYRFDVGQTVTTCTKSLDLVVTARVTNMVRQWPLVAFRLKHFETFKGHVVHDL